MLPLKKIVIVGGGTAGWMAASHFAKRWVPKGIEIEIIDSSRIGTIGVGEGSTPAIVDFLAEIDLEEKDWMPRCNATYKNGIKFDGWSTQPGFESYFHPFFSDLDKSIAYEYIHNTYLRRRGVLAPDHPDEYFSMTALTKKQLSPITSDGSKGPNYSYHFDASKLSELLKEKALSYGAKHRDAEISDVLLSDEGDISELLLKSGARIKADFFIDCTGFQSLLMEKSLKVEHVSFSDHLLNDAAVAFQTPLDGEIPPLTVSTALKHGWSWKIPLTQRYGNGYVYSSKYVSADRAEHELREHLGVLDQELKVKHLKMRLGHLQEPWFKNCAAFGLSQGFIEPLEATALQFVGKSVMDFIDHYEQGEFSNKWRETYNSRILSDFNHIRDYILLHYRTNTRDDTDYWIDAREAGQDSDSLAHLLNLWLTSQDLNKEIERQDIDRYYHSASWHCMLGGTGVYPAPQDCRHSCPDDVRKQFFATKEKVEQFTQHFIGHRESLIRLAETANA